MEMPEIFNEHQLVYQDDTGKVKVSYRDNFLLVFTENSAFEFTADKKNDILDIIFKETGLRQIRKMLIQVTNGNVIPTEDDIWQFLIAADRLKNSAIQQLAYVSEHNIFSKMELEKSLLTNIMTIRVFRSLNDAYRWISG